MKSKSITAERRNKLAQIIVSEGSAKVSDIAKHFHVTTETIRKDLIFLEEQGIVKKSHGGAVSASSFLERPISIKESENVEPKAQIAIKALELIPDNAIIMMDGGSTTFHIAKLLTLKENITVITNSLIIAQVLANTSNNILCLGGKLRGSSRAVTGAWATDIIKTLTVDLTFIGTDSLDDKGPSTLSYEEAQVKQAMLEHGNKTIVVSDSSKLKRQGLFHCGKWSDIDYLITDSGINLSEIDFITSKTTVLIGE